MATYTTAPHANWRRNSYTPPMLIQNSPYDSYAPQASSGGYSPPPTRYPQSYPSDHQQFEPTLSPPRRQAYYPSAAPPQQAPFNYANTSSRSDRLHPAEAYDYFPPPSDAYARPPAPAQYGSDHQQRRYSEASRYSYSDPRRSQSAEPPRRASNASSSSTVATYDRRGNRRRSEGYYYDDEDYRPRHRKSSRAHESGKSRRHSTNSDRYERRPTMGDTAHLMYDTFRGFLGSRR